MTINSRYNHWVTDRDRVLLFNARTLALTRVSTDFRQRFDDAGLTAEETTAMLRGGFLLSDDANELALLEDAHMKLRFLRNTFSLTLMPTFSCNFACGYCYQKPEDHFVGKKMSPEVRDGVLRVVREYFAEAPAEARSLGVTWYGGEPLLGLTVIEDLGGRLRASASELGATYSSSIITNGYILTAGVAERLHNSGVDVCQVTLDGPREIHDARRPLYKSNKSTYEVITRNLLSIPVGLLGINVRVNVDFSSVDSVPGLLQDLADRGLAQRPDVRIMFAAVHATTTSCRDVASGCANPKQFAPIQLDLAKRALDLGFTVNTYPTLSTGQCAAVSGHGIVVEPSGTVHKCWEMVGYDAFKIGKLDASGLTVTNPQLEQQWLTWSPFKDPVCVACDVLPMCMGGCAQRDIHREVTSFSPDDPHEVVKCNTRKFILGDLIKLHVSQAPSAGAATQPRATDCAT